MDKTLNKLIQLSHQLAENQYQLVILGEGNTSADCGDGTFWVKASGSQLATINEEGFSLVNKEFVLRLIKKDQMTDQEVAAGLKDSLADKSHHKPSVETFLHAIFLSEGGAKWVGHTHPVSILSFLCSKVGAEPFLNHIFPDEIVVCGELPMVVPYVDPGLLLAKKMLDTLHSYQDKMGCSPKMVLMENHGLLALGQTSREVFNISIMADKWARVMIGNYAMGGPNYLSEKYANRIENRPDEHYRRQKLAK
jgi:rhamnose utilization protein RhaD (predicted bifunctional aldolase and dehydrogenase)